MNGREKRNLKSLAKTRSIDLKIGKKGLTDTFLEEADKVLNKESMIKFSHSLIKAEKNELITKIEDKLSVNLIEKVGRTLTFHKTSS